jgi:hypothetical protein
MEQMTRIDFDIDNEENIGQTAAQRARSLRELVANNSGVALIIVLFCFTASTMLIAKSFTSYVAATVTPSTNIDMPVNQPLRKSQQKPQGDSTTSPSKKQS